MSEPFLSMPLKINGAIKAADSFFTGRYYVKAAKAYTKALNLILEEKLCQDQVSKCYMNRGKSLYYIGRFGEAKTLLLQVRDLNLEDDGIVQEIKNLDQTSLAIEKAEAAYKTKNSKTAVKEFKIAFELCPELLLLRINYLECLCETEEFQKALELCHQSSPEISSNKDFLYYKGLALIYSGKTLDGRTVWVDALKLYPGMKMFEIAIQIINEQIRAKENGNLLFKARGYSEAAEIYTKGIEADPNNKLFCSILYANRAHAYIKLGKFSLALKDCNQAIKLNASYAKAFLRRGEAKMELRDYDGAFKDFTKADQLDPLLDAEKKAKAAKKEAEEAHKNNYYRILEVNNSATSEEIKKNYRKLSLKYHPDKNKNSEEMMKRINIARSVLLDPEKRKKYDDRLNPSFNRQNTSTPRSKGEGSFTFYYDY